MIQNLGSNTIDILLKKRVYEKTCFGKELMGTLLHFVAKSGAINCFDTLRRFLGNDFKHLFTIIEEKSPVFYAVELDNLMMLEKLAVTFPTLYE